jgi:hypothetical protein
VVLTFSAVGFTLLRLAITKYHPPHASAIEHHRRAMLKSMWANVLYASSVPLAFFHTYVSFFIFLLIPAMYFLPERKIEELAGEHHEQ